MEFLILIYLIPDSYLVEISTPHNITCQGTHDLTTGMEVGTVVAAISLYKSKIGKPFNCMANVLTIG